MLSTKDLDKIRKVIREEISNAFTYKVKYEKVRDEKTGQPLAQKELVEETEFLPIWLRTFLPYLEGSLRGNQETLDKHAAQIRRLEKGVDASVNILLSMEKPVKQIAGMNNQQIEYTHDSKLAKLEAIITSEEASKAERDKAREQYKSITGKNYESNS